MSRGFGTTYGVGTTDAIQTTYLDANGPLSFGIAVYRNGDGGGGFARFFDTTANERIILNRSDDSTVQFSYGWTGGGGEWRWARPSGGVWHWYLLTYDPSSSTNDPALWIDGVNQGAPTETGAPVTAPLPNTAAYCIGNRPSDSLRNWDGMIDEFAIWNRLLTPREAAQHGMLHYSPLWFPVGLQLYVRDHLTVEWRAGVGQRNHPTLTGTKPGDPLPIIHPPWMKRRAA